MIGPVVTFLARLRRLARHREGNIAILFGLSAIPLVVGAGIAIDTVRAYSVKEQLSAALDAAALAVGSNTSTNSTTLTTAMQNYFNANFQGPALSTSCPAATNPTSITPVPGNASLSAISVTFQAQTTVPMTFMSLVGIDCVTVSATAQILRTAGIEVALALDNTGSMLCGPTAMLDGQYNDGQCATGVPSGGTDPGCADSATVDQSRICTMMNAATDFVKILEGAMASQEQLYIGVVPYVTTVNVGGTFCTGALVCGNQMATDCSGDLVNDTQNTIFDPNTAVAQPGSTTVAPTGIAGTVATNSNTITLISPNTASLIVGMSVSGTGIPNGTTITSVDGTSQIHISKAATQNGSGETLSFSITLSGFVGYYAATNAGNVLTIANPASVSSNAALTATEVVAAPSSNPMGIGITNYSGGYPQASSIQSVNTSNNTITLCQATQQAYGVPIQLTLYPPLQYDTTHTAATENWMGCVVEPTSVTENSGVTGVQNWPSANPDFTEPASGTQWYAYWWYPNGPGGNTNPATNAWTPTGREAIVGQSTANEILGQVTVDWDTFPGPNQGCPVPLLPLTNVGSQTGVNAVNNTIRSMWPRDAGGTQVHIGAIWAWRELSATGPFASNNGHPLSYSTATSTGWLKVMVLMTDGEEEWPAPTQFTGVGYLTDGKLGTTSSTTAAVTTLDNRLASVCSNMAADGIIIYTVGLGDDGGGGANNTQLKSCPANGGYFISANPSTIDAAFTQIAQSLIALRLSQ